jgi:pyridoxal phosphate enzyme (YggS family)
MTVFWDITILEASGLWKYVTVSDPRAILSDNRAAVEERILAACRRAGRTRSEVALVAITKYVSPEIARLLFELGETNLGESRPQELWRKAAAIPEAHWHLVGHLQRNKIERTLPVVRLIHSVDSFRLLEALDGETRKVNARCNLQPVVPVLLEFNLSGEDAKHGFAAGDLPLIPSALQALQSVRVVGLMTMAALGENAEQARPTFAALRQLREKLAAELPSGHSLCHQLDHLSMGMTNDFEVAIEEGATLVRIGSALFQGLENRSA